MKIIGWVGSILFAGCAIPQAYQCWQTGNAVGIDGLFLCMWGTGEVCTLIYIYPKRDYPLLVNYCCNLSALLVIVYFKLFGV